MVLPFHNQNSKTAEPLPPPPDGDTDTIVSVCGEMPRFSEDFDSACSSPYVSAPSSPGRGGGASAGYFYSAPASPMHYVLLSSSAAAAHHRSESSSLMSPQCDNNASFEFSSRFSGSGSAIGSMCSADELFLNGQIRPMKLSSHLQNPQNLAPLIDLDVEDKESESKTGDVSEKRVASRGRDLELRSRSLHRKTRSLSPLRNPEFQWDEEDRNGEREVREDILESLEKFDDRKESETVSSETTPSTSASSSRSSSSGRNSKKWIFLKDLLYRSKSEGRGNGKEKFWSSISFSPKDKKLNPPLLNPSREKKKSASSSETAADSGKQKQKEKPKQKEDKDKQQPPAKKIAAGKPTNGIAKRRVPPSAHELHYTAKRAQAEEMKKRTYLPYRHGLFGCMGFTSKGYGALNGLARTLNPVSSR